MLQLISPQVLPLTKAVALCLEQYFPFLSIHVVQDQPGEDHVYAQHDGKPAFDLLVTTARKFVFLWYYALPSRVAGDRGMQLVDELRTIAVDSGFDLVVKYAWAQVKPGAPALIIRQGKSDMGASMFVHPKFQRFIIKGGNPELDVEQHSELFLATYRNYDWVYPEALPRLRARTAQLMEESLDRNNKGALRSELRGYLLYAGCAFHYVFPRMGFGMRDIDVNVFFSPAAYSKGVRSSRGVLTRPCGVDEFGKPEYFHNNTRLLDVMWNVLKQDSGDRRADILHYMQTMRQTSDRWATISQRPFIDLNDGTVFYLPNWLRRMRNHPAGRQLAVLRPGIQLDPALEAIDAPTSEPSSQAPESAAVQPQQVLA